MNTKKARLLEEKLTFDTSDYPDWTGNAGKCWVDFEEQNVTIVGWYINKGSPVNNYKLIMENKQRNSKSGVKKWIELTGFDDTGKEINKKVFGTSFDESVDAMLKTANAGYTSVGSMVQAIAYNIEFDTLHF